MKQIEDIARQKMPDLNTSDLESAKKTIMGSAPAWASTSSNRKGSKNG